MSDNFENEVEENSYDQMRRQLREEVESDSGSSSRQKRQDQGSDSSNPSKVERTELSSDGKRVKVYKRKRRSYQPIYRIREERAKKRRKIMIAMSILAIPLLVCFFGLIYLFKWRVESDKFAAKISDYVTQISGMNVSVGNFKIGGRFINAKKLRIRPKSKPDSASSELKITEASFHDIRANTSPKTYFGNSWLLKNIQIRRAYFSLQSAKKNVLGDLPVEQFSQNEILKAGIGLTDKPDQILIENFSIVESEIDINGKKIISDALIRNDYSDRSPLLLDSTSMKNLLLNRSLYMNDAKLVIPQLPEKIWRLEDVVFTVLPDRVDIRKGKIYLGQSALSQGEINGKIQTVEKAEFVGSANFKNIELNKLLDKKKWGEKINGNIALHLNLKSSLTDFKSEFQGRIPNGKISLSQIPVLQKMAELSGVNLLNTLNFEAITADVTYDKINEIITLENIEAIAPNLIQVKGKINIDQKYEIKGDLSIGLHLDLINSSLSAFSAIIKNSAQRKYEYYWLPLQISGNHISIRENLSEFFYNALSKNKKLLERLPAELQ